jgi:hypothetical protein
MQKQLADWPEQFWSIVFGLQRVYQLENIAMQQEITVDDVMEIGAELRRLAIASASPKERLAGLTPEQMADLLKQIEALLAQQPTGAARHRRPSKPR